MEISLGISSSSQLSQLSQLSQSSQLSQPMNLLHGGKSTKFIATSTVFVLSVILTLTVFIIVLVYWYTGSFGDNRTEKATATIDDAKCQTLDDLTKYYCALNLKYTDKTGKQQTTLYPTYRWIGNGKYNKNDKINIYYDPSNPTDIIEEPYNRQGSFGVPSRITYFVLLPLFLITIALGVYFIVLLFGETTKKTK